MADPFAEPEDVTVLYRPLSTAETATVTALLAHASVMLRARFPTLDAKILAGTLDPEQVKVAVVNMVLRVLRNPGGLKSETVGPFSRTWDTGSGGGLLTITSAETDILGLVSGTTSAVGSIRLRAGLGGYTGGHDVRCW